MGTECPKIRSCAVRQRSFTSKLHVCLPAKMTLFTVTFALLLANAFCFNLDLRTKVVHEPSGENTVAGGNLKFKIQKGSKFGFSVAQHIEGTNNWLLVGAPEAQTEQRRITKGGAVYKCGITPSSGCELIVFDKFGNNIKLTSRNYSEIENKTNQWFGATLASTGPNGDVVACAPRYIYFSNAINKREPIGQCFQVNARFESPKGLSPCREGVDRPGAWPDEIYNSNRCQCGISLNLLAHNKTSWMFLGAPGSYYWQGQLFSKDMDRPDRVFQSTVEGTKEDDNQQMGYSIATGELNGNNIPDVVGGAPRSHQNGRVLMFTRNLVSLGNITGQQMGSRFGHSVAVLDVNDDGRDDIIVGAPCYSHYEKNLIDVGRVYVFYQDRFHRFTYQNAAILEGTNEYSYGRFGSTLAAADDLNQDGFKDFVVGAPYEGPNQEGAIYVFHGSKDGVNTSHQQIIRGNSISDKTRSFGYSISGGFDLDTNAYPDLLVGAMDSDQAIYLRTRPVVSVNFTRFVSIPRHVKLDRKDVQLADGTNVTGLSFDACFEYKSLNGPEKISIDMDWKLDSLKSLTKRYFLKDQPLETALTRRNFVLGKGRQHCYRLQGYVKNSVRDKLTNIRAEVTYRLNLNESHYGPQELMPVLNQYISTTRHADAPIWKDCGDDNVCIPDLKVSAQSLMAYYPLGSHEDFIISVDITNAGDGAYESLFLITLPPGVKYVTIFDVKSATPITCTKLEVDVSCDMGNPFPEHSSIQFKILLKPESVNGSTDNLAFFLQANSSNAENQLTVGDNRKDVIIPVKFVSKFSLSGVSKPEQVEYSSNETQQVVRTESDIGPKLTHVYQVVNDGPSSISEVQVVILWPSRTTTGEHMLYLLDAPEVTKDHGSCVANDVNPEKIKIESADGESEKAKSTRKRRAVSAKSKDVKNMECDEDWCEKITCTVTDIEPLKSVVINIKSRVWSQTLAKAGYRYLVLFSKATATVVDVPYSVKPDKLIQKTFQVPITMHSDSIPESKPLEWWWIMIAVAGGVLLLILLVIILWKCGFFRRKRVPDEDLEERETLQVERKQANGGGHGDDDEMLYCYINHKPRKCDKTELWEKTVADAELNAEYTEA